jgi:hypothetical protein
MIELILAILVILFLTGNIHINGFNLPNLVLFRINGQTITLVNTIIFFVILWAIGVLPSPFREIAAVLFVLWLLTVFGILAIAGLPNLLIIAIIVGIVFSIFKR